MQNRQPSAKYCCHLQSMVATIKVSLPDCNTVYNGSISVLLKKALLNRYPEDQKDNEDLIEIDKNIHEALKASIVYKSNIFSY